MRLLKWTVFFIVSFFISWVVIATFSQVEFTMKAPARIILYTTPEIPIYWFTAGAFFLGLIIGLAVAAYNFVFLKTRGSKQSHEMRAIEDEVAKLKTQLEQARASLDEGETQQGERLLDEESSAQGGDAELQDSSEES